MKIIWVNDIRYFSPLVAEVRRIKEIAEWIVRKLGCKGELELRFCDDREIAALNKSFLGIDSPTNVLSFPEDEEDSSLGSLCISLETISREALLYGVGEMEHLCRMVVHGILHLCGYDHGPEMYLKEEELFETLREDLL